MISFDLEYLECFQGIFSIFYPLNRLYAIFWRKVVVELDVVLFFDTVFRMLVVIDQGGVISQEE